MLPVKISKIYDNIISSASRPFNMKIRHINQQMDLITDNYSQFYALLERPFKCTCCCLARPEMTAKSNSTTLGRVIEPFSCCDPLYHVIDNQNQIKWKVSANCCQCGFWCPCSEAIFPIISSGKNDFDPNKSDGYIKKTNAGFQEMVSDATNYEIVFPLNATPVEKFLLIANVLMIDYRYFEKDGKNNN
jgi:hypothetical protein